MHLANNVPVRHILGFLPVTSGSLHVGVVTALKDLAARACEFAKTLKDTHTVIRLMDGHGRMLLFVLLAIVDRFGWDRLTRLRVELVDIDSNVQEWHMNSFGQSKLVVCIKGDIFAVPYDPSTTALYLNFCGMSKSLDMFETFMRQLKQDACILLSFSAARNAKGVPGKVRAYLESLKWHIHYSSDRKDFITWTITLTVDSLVSEQRAYVGADSRLGQPEYQLPPQTAASEPRNSSACHVFQYGIFKN